MPTLHMLKSATDTIITSFVYEEEGVLLVLDGGFESESETLYAHLKARGGHVNAWFLTHAHGDHYGAFCALLRDHGEEIKVDTVYFNFPSLDILNVIGPYDIEANSRLIPEFYALIEKYQIKVVTPLRGDVYPFGTAEMHVIREYDPQMLFDINNTTTVYRLDVGNERVLFLGDLGVLGGEQMLKLAAPEELRADYCQMAHHGQGGVDRPVYEAIKPNCCLWPTPTWVWDNIGPNGYDSGGLQTVIVRGWMSEIGVRRHLIDKDGPHIIKLGES